MRGVFKVPGSVWLSVCVAMLWIMPVAVYASERVYLRSGDDVVLVGSYMQLLEDQDGTQSLESVKIRTDWEKSRKSEPNMGFSPSVWWGRLSVQVDKKNDAIYYLLIDDAIVNQLSIYFVHDDGRVTTSSGGGYLPVKTRELPYRSHAFVIPARAGQSVEIYMRVASELAVVLPVQVVESRQFVKLTTVNAWVYALYFGFLLAMLIFNAMVGIRMRQWLNIWYSGFTLSMILIGLSFSGYGRQFFWPVPPGMDNAMLAVSSAYAGVFATVFNEKFLFDAHPQKPLVALAFRWAVLSLALVTTMLALLEIYRTAMQVGAVCTFVAVIGFVANSLYGVYAKVRGARLLLFAWSGILVGTLVFVARGFGILPSNMVTTYSLQFSSMLESFLLMVAIIEKARYVRAELLRATEASKIFLEREVRERTNALRRAQLKIVEHERRQSLVVFAAGMAHEINNPANFISAGAQSSVAYIDGLYHMLDGMLDDDADPLFRNELKQRFSMVVDDFNTIESCTKAITERVSEFRRLNPEGDAGVISVDVGDLFERAIKRIVPSAMMPAEVTNKLDSPPLVLARIADVNAVVETVLAWCVDLDRQYALPGQNFMTAEVVVDGHEVKAVCSRRWAPDGNTHMQQAQSGATGRSMAVDDALSAAIETARVYSADIIVDTTVSEYRIEIRWPRYQA